MSISLIRIATRGSALALAQTQIVVDAIKQQHPDLTIQIKTVTTAGDQDRISPLWKMTGTGFFTTQIEQTLIEKKADIAVHSYKDLPMQMCEDLTIAAVLDRRFSEDVVVVRRAAKTLDEIPAAAVIGTSSLRRMAQIKHARPDLRVQPIRGNVETRLRKIEKGEYDAVVLARAGLERLGLGEKIAFVMNPQEFVPAPAQGALAVQCRREDRQLLSLLQGINHAATQQIVNTERRVFSALHPGCHAPVGVFAFLKDDIMNITAVVCDNEGKHLIRKQVSGSAESANGLADEMIQKLFEAGAEQIIREYKNE